VKSADAHSDSIKRSKVFPNSALSAAVENFVAVKSDGRNGLLGMVISAQKEQGQPKPTLFLALVETVTVSLEHSPNGYAITHTC
jgi:hypothetical protein